MGVIPKFVVFVQNLQGILRKDWEELKDLYNYFENHVDIKRIGEKCPYFLNSKESFKKIQRLNKLSCKEFRKDRKSLETQDKVGNSEHSADPGEGHSGSSSLLGDVQDYIFLIF
ncbi:hypothetical protein POVCU2_0014250 [Plasmodium ovale curtisi]|uniref:PIR Superfamily Protein n=1 Tax=Plasmodium ovale curtisi TaxID=864141 RepID=A0A1A8VTM9_PLAOA|nr:hypothetical protein POVCU2_0014250 [Plasmodium ovale curtisi]SBT01550.1 hypothetical protein POVCU1_067740 [Plasmodium ovale curtisi]